VKAGDSVTAVTNCNAAHTSLSELPESPRADWRRFPTGRADA
jgi:hypothetical protein